jgi:hypothetical protein
MAHAIAKAQTISHKVQVKRAENVTNQDLLDADGIIMGSRFIWANDLTPQAVFDALFLFIVSLRERWVQRSQAAAE